MNTRDLRMFSDMDGMDASYQEALREDEQSYIAHLRSQLHDELRAGTTCPVCDQHAQEYRRKLNAGMAHALVVMYAKCGLNFFYKPDVLRGVGASARDESLLRFWRLIDERHKNHADGHSGWWRVTEKGAAFVEERITVPKYVTVYNGRPTGFEGERVMISDCLGSRFSLRELLDAA